MRTRSSGDLIDGKYRLEKPLARGGMGEVWTAKNLQLDVPVAIKLMSAHALSSLDLVARFKREARAAAQLRHPNVVTIFEYGVFDGVPFMAMELLEGEDLSARVKQRGRLPHAEALAVISGVCKALRRAHEMGIVHRDLKPANVFLARQYDEEIVKVLDFGIAKLLGGEIGAESTKAGGVLGTPHYMAPEQAQDTGVKIDHRADLWALGVITFRMLTGKLPFTGADAVQLLVRVCTERPPAASSIAPDLHAGIDAFFARALARHPADRFQSARDFADAFAALGERPRVDPLASRASDPPSDGRGGTRPMLGSAPFAAGSPISGPTPLPPMAAHSAGASTPPAARASAPGAPGSMSAGTRYPAEDPLDVAQTLPLQASPRAQAAHAQAMQSGPRAGQGTVPMMTGYGAAPVPAAPVAGHAAPAFRHVDAWSGDSSGLPTLATSSVEAGTITRANTEAEPPPPATAKRNTVIVVGAFLAAVLVIAVVAWTVVSATTTETADEVPPIPLPTATAAGMHLTVDAPSGDVPPAGFTASSSGAHSVPAGTTTAPSVVSAASTAPAVPTGTTSSPVSTAPSTKAATPVKPPSPGQGVTKKPAPPKPDPMKTPTF